MEPVKEEERYIDLPEIYSRRQLNGLYREAGFKDAAFRQLRKYFCAMANLYGILPLGKAFEIISAQSPRLVTEETFLAFADIARHECENYYILGMDELYTDGVLKSPMDRELVGIEVFDAGMDFYHHIFRSQQGKPWYVPGKAELLAYAEHFHTDAEEETEALLSFFTHRMRLGEEKGLLAVACLLEGLRYKDLGMEDLMEHLADKGVVFQKLRDLEQFQRLYMEFHNHTRLPCNRGYTPEELAAWRRALEEPIWTGAADPEAGGASPLAWQEAQPYGGAARREKVGRNDPCPCGSGKKYKKCCGR